MFYREVHGIRATIACNQRNPCCAGPDCWFRLAPEHLEGTSLGGLLVFLVLGATLFVALKHVGVTPWEVLKISICCLICCYSMYRHGTLKALRIPYFPHPLAYPGKIYEGLARSVIGIGTFHYGLLCRVALGPDWHARVNAGLDLAGVPDPTSTEAAPEEAPPCAQGVPVVEGTVVPGPDEAIWMAGDAPIAHATLTLRGRHSSSTAVAVSTLTPTVTATSVSPANPAVIDSDGQQCPP